MYLLYVEDLENIQQDLMLTYRLFFLDARKRASGPYSE